MSHVVEDGTGKIDADSYVSDSDFSAYISARGITVTSLTTNILTVAMDYLEQQDFKGYKNTKAQALQWPRNGVVIDGFDIDTNEIPLLLKEAQIEFAIAVDLGESPTNNVQRETKMEKVDVIEVEYMDNARAQTYLKAANLKLSKLLSNNGSLKVIRA